METEFDERQGEAICTDENVVVTAGAGSGKTKVLAARFAHLIMEAGLKAEEILTMTFTNKAANEMSDRIYKTLLEHKDNEYARNAVLEFNKAQITTFDSFYAQIARIAAPRYGIPGDFFSDDGAANEMARNAAIPFSLENRENEYLQNLICTKSVRAVSEGIFVSAVVGSKMSSITKPLNCFSYYQKQHDEICVQWVKHYEKLVSKITEIKAFINSEKEKKALRREAVEELDKVVSGNKIDVYNLFDHQAILKFINYLHDFNNEKLYRASKEIFDPLREIFTSITAIGNTILNFNTIKEIFSLVDTFEDRFNNKKRTSGILTFSDIANLALQSLLDFPDIRILYKKQFKAIMCDEFQDNNLLQHDILFLLAENIERKAHSVPLANELIRNKLFFVGDEKQSIYKFRGADVSVFSSLLLEIKKRIDLNHNYRSEPSLIESFNFFFGGEAAIFLKERVQDELYEATYTHIYSNETLDKNQKPSLNICVLDMSKIEEGKKKDYLKAYESEALFVARTIQKMVQEGVLVRKREGGGIVYAKCNYGDFAVLQRTLTRQGIFEKHLRKLCIPYNAMKETGLFYEAPINDIVNVLRLVCYPHDALSYAAVLKSPFMRFDEEMRLICLLHFNSTNIPFDLNAENDLDDDQKKLFIAAKSYYEEIKSLSFVLDSQNIVLRLWNDYRYNLVCSNTIDEYCELFEYLFEMAKICDEKTKNLSEFLDYIEDQKKSGNDSDIPFERKSGVSLMTIHKSKGLEFPIVFIVAASSAAKNKGNNEMIYFDKEYGPCINLNASDELEDAKPLNYFYTIAKEQEKKKEIAELKRLLYVAMTRAESKLFITAIDANRKNSTPSLFDLLKPAINADAEKKFYNFLEIPAVKKEELGEEFYTEDFEKKDIRKKIQNALPFYKEAKLISPSQPLTFFLNASNLEARGLNGGELFASDGLEQNVFDDEITSLIKKADIGFETFGTLLHNCMEALIQEKEIELSKSLLYLTENKYYFELLTCTKKLASSFFDTDVGKLCSEAEFKETEYSFMTLFKMQNKNIYVAGTIDLLFACKNELYIVDYKTDRIENPQNHKNQLAIYKKACSELFEEYKQIHTILFYPRTIKTHNIDGLVEKVNFNDVFTGAHLAPNN